MFLNIGKLLLIVSLLTACGGGSSSSSDVDNDENTNNNIDSNQDKTAPIITVLGENPISVTQYTTYTDAGAIAKDDIDGVVKVRNSGSVDTSVIKDYTITYTAIDKAGNKATASRTITVNPVETVWNVSDVTEFRQALENASVNGENDKIILSAGTYNTDTDGLGTFKFDDQEKYTLTIEADSGLTYDDVIISGNNSHQVFNFNNIAESTISLKNISIVEGNVSAEPVNRNGGGVYVNYNLKIEQCKISDNEATQGGGVYLDTKSYKRPISVTIVNSILSNNKAINQGGAFFNYSKDSLIVNSIFLNNSSRAGGDAIYISDHKNYSYISNNIFSNNINEYSNSLYQGSVYSSGTSLFVNNIFDNNDADIYIRKDTKIYNNYIDYTKIKENQNTVIKKDNLQPPSIGEVYLENDNQTLASSSPVIDKGLNPSSATYKQIIDNETIYNQMVELLKTDMVGNKRVYNNTIDMGIIEYGSSK